jgi:hypothetical protein
LRQADERSANETFLSVNPQAALLTRGNAVKKTAPSILKNMINRFDKDF